MDGNPIYMELADDDAVIDDSVMTDDMLTDLPMDDDWLPGDVELDVRAESIADGLAICLGMRGQVDLDYISVITGETQDRILSELKGKIFEDPEQFNRWVTADEYLSGNLISKLKAAKKANDDYPRRYAENIKALRAWLPSGMECDQIHVAIGSPWLPPEIIDDFIEFLIGEKPKASERAKLATRHDPGTGVWEIPCKTRFNMGRHTMKNRNTYGTGRLPFLYLLEDMLNLKTIRVTDEMTDPRNPKKKIRTVNKVETAIAVERQNKLNDKFLRWVWSDGKRAEKLKRIYEERYGCIRKTSYDGSFLRFPTMHPSVKLFPYQKDAVARIIFGNNTLLAHDVGSGKTYVMIAAGMEMRRMGLSKKNMYVVPNNLLVQWETLFHRLYPASRVMVVDAKSFTPTKKLATLKEMRDGDHDAILIAYSCFDRLPISVECYNQSYRESLSELKKAESVFSSKAIIDRKKKSLAGEHERLVRARQVEIDKLKAKDAEAELVCFDTMGITGLFVDEAHNYKNLPIESKISNVYGISANGSKKCRDMLEKVRFVQRSNGGKGVVFATGTPITNSITDIYVMQYYLQGGELALMGISEFDSWVGMFSERETNFEVDIDTSSFRMATRFSRFHNLPELTAILSSVADFHRTNPEENSIPEFDGYTDLTLRGSAEFKAFISDISKRADNVRSRRVSREEDNMLKITGDGRKGALDLRLIDENIPVTDLNKAQCCANAVYDVYCRSGDIKGTQLIFCDSSIPKPGFNMYREVKGLLMEKGVPDDEIAFIHDVGESDRRRDKLFEDVRKGNVRVLIGS
ncbi:MAG: DEAD/DEAH box helicase family protein, partial [Clostridia bacterium]|nr:DEAD/DEAH box helicase family protein [Clostridia bacterium]